MAFEVHGGGEAYVFTNGKVIHGTWKRKSDYEPNVFYDDNGKEIIFNQGKTWICEIWKEYSPPACGPICRPVRRSQESSWYPLLCSQYAAALDASAPTFPERTTKGICIPAKEHGYLPDTVLT